MSEPVPQLNYARPTNPRGPLRKKAVSHCLGNGIGAILLGMLIVLVAGVSVDRAGTGVVVIGLIQGVYALVFVASGTIYLMASFKIRLPNRMWERVVVITGVIHITFIALAFIALGVMLPGVRRTGLVSYVAVVFSFVMLLSLLQGIQYVRKAGRETWDAG